MKRALAAAALSLAILIQEEDPFDDPFFDWPDAEEWPETPEDLPPDDPEGLPQLPPDEPPDGYPELPPELPPDEPPEEYYEPPNPEHLERIRLRQPGWPSAIRNITLDLSDDGEKKRITSSSKKVRPVAPIPSA